MTRFLKIVFAVSLVLAAAATALAAEDKAGFLRIEGGKVVDSSGAEIVLRGVNVEFKNFQEVLGKRDIARIAGLGANVVRLVLDYRDFEPEPFQYREESFALLEQILSWCEEHQVYVILDMHLAPGKQNAHDFVVHRQPQPLFWRDRQRQERFYALWAEIAGRFADRRIIAGYDLLNEGTPETGSQYQEVMAAAAARIRAVDRNHMLIVEEAILPGWRKQLLPIDDPNVLYSVHFFHPPQFAFYATTSSRPLTSYPGEMIKAGQPISSNRARVGRNAGGWQRLEVRATPPEGAELLLVTLYSEKNRGRVWFDDLHLEVNGRAIDLPAPLVANNSFEIDYPGFNWNTQGDCLVLDHGKARTGSRALRFAGCDQPASARSSPIPVQEGEYVLSGWYKSDRPAGAAGISLNWHQRRSIGRIDRDALLEELGYALAFKKRHNVPLYVGEFTMHANPWPESAGRYLRDLLEIMEAEGLHWTFWEYYSEYPGVGLLRGNPPVVGNPVALEILEEYFRPRRGAGPHLEN